MNGPIACFGITSRKTQKRERTLSGARTTLMTQNEIIQETSFPHDDENSVAQSTCMSTESTRSISLPSIRTYDDYELSSCAIPCRHQSTCSPSLTSSGYAKYRATPPPNRELKKKKILHSTLFVLGTLGGFILLLISLTSLLGKPDDDQPELEDEPINELVLVLNTLAPENKPVIISFNGSWRSVPEFQYSQVGLQKNASSMKIDTGCTGSFLKTHVS